MTKEALVFSGGGAEGAYQVGVLKALTEKGLDPDIMTGTSIGAFSAAFLLGSWHRHGRDAVKKLEDIWLDHIAGTLTGDNGGFRIRANPMELVNPRAYRNNPFGPMMQMFRDTTFLAEDTLRRVTNLVSSDSPLLSRLMGLVNISSFISVEPWEKLLKEEVDYEAVRNSDKTLRLVAINWATGKPKFFERKDMTDEDGWRAIRASSAMPGLFPTIELEGDPYVDGGVLMNTPLKPAIRAGADVLHVINMNSAISTIPPADPPNTMETFYRQQLIEWASALNRDIERAESYNKGMLLMEGRTEKLAESPNLRHASTAVHLAKAAASDRPAYRYLTIHRYHPRQSSGDVLSLMDIRREKIEDWIAQGYEDAKDHHCEAAGCVLAPDAD
ncbi:MAG: patatin-like phospholipase family protein [Acidobacteriota bacterium]|nr:patatin-like phospholipase family protein [Acidobacteriota bacterium]